MYLIFCIVQLPRQLCVVEHTTQFIAVGDMRVPLNHFQLGVWECSKILCVPIILYCPVTNTTLCGGARCPFNISWGHEWYIKEFQLSVWEYFLNITRVNILYFLVAKTCLCGEACCPVHISWGYECSFQSFSFGCMSILFKYHQS